MKNILKWCVGFLIVMVLVTGLKLAKFSLLRPPDMDERIADGRPNDPLWQNGPSAAFHLDEHDLEKHPPFVDHPHSGMEWAFVMADLIDLLVYALILLPLFYAAYLLGKRTLHLQRLNTARAPMVNSFKPDDKPEDARSPAESDYLWLDNHMLDQLL